MHSLYTAGTTAERTEAFFVEADALAVATSDQDVVIALTALDFYKFVAFVKADCALTNLHDVEKFGNRRLFNQAVARRHNEVAVWRNRVDVVVRFLAQNRVRVNRVLGGDNVALAVYRVVAVNLSVVDLAPARQHVNRQANHSGNALVLVELK